MRWLAFLLLLAPSAAAQAPVELATLEIAPFPTEVVPLQGVLTTTGQLRASCTLADPPAGVLVTYLVSSAPAWATTLVSPASEALDPARCEGGWLTSTPTITLTASDQAPAFAPAPIVVQAIVGSGAREQRVDASVAASASYFSILDVQLPESQVVLAPGASHEFVVRFTNFGNGPTRVEATLVEAGEGLEVQLPAPFTLESKQSGGNRISSDEVVRVATAPADGFVNRVGIINLRFASAYATDDSYRGDEATVSLLVTTRTGGEDGGPLGERARALPAPSILALVAIAALLGLLMRRPLRP